MNYLLFIGSLILGSLFKLYDEIVDNNLKINKEYIVILQISIVFLSFYLYHKDSLFMVFCIIAYYSAYIYDYILLNNNVIDHTQIAMNDSFWHLYAIVLIPIFIFNYKNIITYNYINIKTNTFILTFCIGFILCLLEAYLFPEETSSAKIIFRILCLLFFCCSLFIILYFKSYFYIAIPLIYLFWTGYFATSIIFKQYIISDSSINILDTLTYIWKKLKSKKLKEKLKKKREKKKEKREIEERKEIK